MSRGLRRAGLALLVVLFTKFLEPIGVADALMRPDCNADSEQSPLSIIQSAPCGDYGIVTTRRANVGGVEVDITVGFMLMRPSGPRKGLVVLFPGGNGNAGIEVDAHSKKVTNTSNNFLVRSAEVFALHGYLTLVLDRPSSAPIANADYDQYRISALHAQDIVAVVSHVNSANDRIFLAGTSRGTLSVVAQHMLGLGSLLSSPVTSASGTALYIGHPGTPNLQSGFVNVPVHVMTHAADGCFVSTPAGAAALHSQFMTAGVDSTFDSLTGGFDLTGTDSITPCDALTFHGFLGIENVAVGAISTRMDSILDQLEALYPRNQRPRARSTTVATSMPFAVSIDLRRLTVDPDDHDQLTYTLPYPTSSRGASIALAGSIATYWPIEPGITDGFVYLVSDGKGGTTPAIVRVVVQ